MIPVCLHHYINKIQFGYSYLMINVDVSKDGNDAPAVCVEEHAEDIDRKCKTDPSLEWK